MAVAHAQDARNTLADTIAALVDAGGKPGTLQLQTAGGLAVATLRFSYPAFEPAILGRAKARPIEPDRSAAGGRAAKASIRNSADREIFTCSVTQKGGGGDIELDETLIPARQVARVDAFAYIAPV